MTTVLVNAADLLANPSGERQFIDVRHDLMNHQ